ncbi:MAG: 4-hydroxythreonine-4-phosphate dehydrogenase PdxA [Betaproteobacteria bacterium]|jgi:4-hydroxythreonine-4-phosphate dehydrogenase (EC 1.1.1.262)|nr:4-hydroxythreonine-4-phosphate dehydrogenase PdxA [Betaproteobacteria bacterium]
MTTKPRIAISAGEPAGIGPDLCLWLARQSLSCQLVIAADSLMMRQRAMQLGCPYPFIDAHRPDFSWDDPRPILWHHPLPAPTRPGHPDTRNSRALLNTLDSLVDLCSQKKADALVTAPLQKSVFQEAGIPFTGHTEYLAARLSTPEVVMMLVGGNLRVALATTHLPLREVPDAIQPDRLRRTLEILHHDLIHHFGVPSPRILVAGLNPHAGERGHLGREEIEVITPVIEKIRRKQWLVSGPYPADTLFLPERLKQADAILAMYHDQGLPVLKHASFGQGVNITLGLPILRTSVDHGTALDRTGTGHMETGSMLAAVNLACELTLTRQRS